jgi:uncharacterized damage-inducible protein DinB
MHWADMQIWESLRKTEQAVGDENALQLLFHIHLVQHIFLSLWNNEEYEIKKLSDFKDLDSIIDYGIDYFNRLKVFMESIKEIDYDRELIVPWAKRAEDFIGRPIVNANLGDTMLQIVSHSAYHRGQINRRIRELKGEPPPVDYILWVWMNKPNAGGG